MRKELVFKGSSLFGGLLFCLSLFFPSSGIAREVFWDPGILENASAGGFETPWNSGGLVPAASFRKGSESGLLRKDALPLSFDLRTSGMVSSVKNQGKFDTCWAFAALGALESSLMLQGASWNFSELYLAYYTYGDFDAQEPGFTKPFPERNVLDQMGSDQKAVAVLARWRGPVAESEVPYPAPPLYVIFDPSGNEPVPVHLQQAWSVPWKASLPELAPKLKELIRTCGGSTAHLYMPMEGYEAWFNENTRAYRYNGENASNHAVLLVGWDDSYGAENFLDPPEGDGAWIAKNSWGENFGENGFFYISYYDTSLWGGTAYRGESAVNYSGVYQYDPLGVISRMGFGGSRGQFANVFTARQDETIVAASFYTPVGESAYVIRGSRKLSGDPSSGTDLGVLAKGTLPYGGYSTVPLEKNFSVKEGEKFSLQVALETPEYSYPVPVEEPREGYSDKASAEPGQSYVRSEDAHAWEDLAVRHKKNGNVCLKAFAGWKGTPPPLPGASTGGGGCSLGGGNSLIFLGGLFFLLVLDRRK